MKSFLSTVLFFSFLIGTPMVINGHDLKSAVDSMDRTEAFKVRDKYRNPYETISFFQIKPNMTVIELSPGGGWYTEIFAIICMNLAT